MFDRDSSGEVLGIPYNFEPPKVTRMLKAYWQPGEGMLVPKPFGVGYTLNLANWRSWVVIAVALVLLRVGGEEDADDATDDEPVEVLVDEE